MFGFKNLLALVGLAVVGFVAAGYYLGWYNIGAQMDSQGNKKLEIQVDASKVEHDIHQGEQVVEKKLQNRTAVSGSTPQAPPAPAVTPSLPGMPPGMSDQPAPANLPSVPPAPQDWTAPQVPAPPPVDVYNMPR
jgi:hypothetical protein